MSEIYQTPEFYSRVTPSSDILDDDPEYTKDPIFDSGELAIISGVELAVGTGVAALVGDLILELKQAKEHGRS